MFKFYAVACTLVRIDPVIMLDSSPFSDHHWCCRICSTFMLLKRKCHLLQRGLYPLAKWSLSLQNGCASCELKKAFWDERGRSCKKCLYKLNKVGAIKNVSEYFLIRVNVLFPRPIAARFRLSDLLKCQRGTADQTPQNQLHNTQDT